MSDKPIKVEYDEPKPQASQNQPQRVENLFGFIKQVSSAPTWVPKTLYEQFAIYKNGSTYRFYWYDFSGAVWKYATGT